MNKRITFNGVELSLPRYDSSAVTMFDYLDDVVTRLEKELGEEDGNFQLSINMDFSPSKPLQYKIYANGSTKKKTKDKVARVLKKTDGSKFNQVSGSMRVNLMVGENR